jgi:hypothetical protein
MIRRSVFIAFLLSFAPFAFAGETGKLADELRPILAVIDGSTAQFTLTVEADFVLGKEPQHAKVTLSRAGNQRFSLTVEHANYPLILIREPGKTVLALPAKGVQFVGEGPVRGKDVLSPDGVLDRMVSGDSAASTYYTIIKHSPAYMAAASLTQLAGLKSDDDGVTWTADALGNAKLTFPDATHAVIEATGATIKGALTDQPTAGEIPDGLTTVNVDRSELERLIVRGVHRATEVAAPGGALTDPSHSNRKIEHGELRWVGDQRLVLLSGSPEQIGKAHGTLLKKEIHRCCDSTLYLVGMAATMHTGKWFPDELRNAYNQLQKHIPDDHKAEMDAIADAAGLSHDEAHLANVFPELFHCSGFALFGKATVGGKLYHGRVLDYMTEIGLQDCATVFIVAPDKKIPFANVGYAGFVGSVTGMNAKQISLGEMGGRGEGQWDGVPMATLMRRALEECGTLDEVKALWSTSPRTCAYYYVFADGKIPDAVGVAATPEKCEFLKPGASHELLGPGIEDAVVLSAGDRLTALRQRVQSVYGQVDAEKAMGLMCRPVAMKSNLHDVLFIPQDGIFYVANADHKQPAAERAYHKYDLAELVKGMAEQIAK